MTPALIKAIEELQTTFPQAKVTVEDDSNGGARVIVEPVSLEVIKYIQEETWLGAHIPAQIPYADIYPLFVRGDLARKNGGALGEAMTPGHKFMGRDAVQVSRRSNARDPLIETPAMKFLKVITWIRSRP